MKRSIAVLTSRFPYPLVKGDKLRIYHHIKELSVHFDIHLYCINDEYPSEEAYEAVTLYCRHISVYLLSERQRQLNMVMHLGTGMPMQVRYFYDKHIHAQIKLALAYRSPDHIHTHLIRMAPYMDDLDPSIPMSIDYMDSMVLNDLAGQYLGRGLRVVLRGRERRLVRAYELAIMDRFQHCFMISERDRLTLPEERQGKIDLLSNGVDMDLYSPDTEETRHSHDLIFCGNLSYHPNMEAASFLIKDIMPLLDRVTCLIAGADPGQGIRDITGPNIEIKGYQEDMVSIYRRGKVMVVPIFTGSGQQNKVLEAMACGTPCIVTSFVNRAIGAAPNKEVLISDDAATFAKHIKRLISRPEEMTSMSEAARLFVESKYSWRTNTEILIRSIESTPTKDIES